MISSAISIVLGVLMLGRAFWPSSKKDKFQFYLLVLFGLVFLIGGIASIKEKRKPESKGQMESSAKIKYPEPRKNGGGEVAKQMIENNPQADDVKQGLNSQTIELTEGNKSYFIVLAKQAVQSRLKDSDSARFRNVYYHVSQKGGYMICGEVNSKNGFGGYGGFEGFISNGKPDVTFLQSEMQNNREWKKVWNGVCR